MVAILKFCIIVKNSLSDVVVPAIYLKSVYSHIPTVTFHASFRKCTTRRNFVTNLLHCKSFYLYDVTVVCGVVQDIQYIQQIYVWASSVTKRIAIGNIKFIEQWNLLIEDFSAHKKAPVSNSCSWLLRRTFLYVGVAKIEWFMKINLYYFIDNLFLVALSVLYNTF